MVDDILGISQCGVKAVELNALINAKIESKKLRLSADKCYKIHICKKKSKCSTNIFVHDNLMKHKSQFSYLGEIVNEKGSLEDTIEARYQKSIGINSQISSVTCNITLGYFHFPTSFIMRESMLLNGILTNCEVWTFLTQKQIERLQSADIMFMRNCFNSHSKTPRELYYLEAGCIELKHIISKRRFMYLWHILSREETELIKKVYRVQSIKPGKNDFYSLIQNEKNKYDICLTDSEISKMSKSAFKRIVDLQIRKFAFNSLINIAMTHSKSVKIAEKLTFKKFKMQQYLNHPSISKNEGQLLFALRSRTLPLKNNMKSSHIYDLTCSLCEDEDSCDEETHLTSCPILKDEIKENEEDISYNHVFGSIEQQIRAVKLFVRIIRKRDTYINVMKKK